MATFDQHSRSAHCREKEQRSDFCVYKQDCKWCNMLMSDQIAQVSTNIYKIKLEKKSEELVASPYKVDAGVEFHSVEFTI